MEIAKNCITTYWCWLWLIASAETSLGCSWEERGRRKERGRKRSLTGRVTASLLKLCWNWEERGWTGFFWMPECSHSVTDPKRTRNTSYFWICSDALHTITEKRKRGAGRVRRGIHLHSTRRKRKTVTNRSQKVEQFRKRQWNGEAERWLLSWT